MLGLFRNKWVLALLAFLGLTGAGGYFGQGYIAPYLPSWASLTASADAGEADSSEEGSGEPQSTDPTAAPSTNATPGSTTQVANNTSSSQRPLMVGTFNIQKFGETKMSKSDVIAKLEQIALLYDVLAVQEVVSQDANVIKNFVTELNKKHNVTFNYVTGPWMGDTSYKESYAFIYDTNRVSLVEHPFVVADPENKMHREPLVARFQVRSETDPNPFSFVMVNVHTDPDVAAAEMDHVSDVINYLETLYNGTEDDILVVGDFNLAPDKIRAETKFAARTQWDSVLGPAVMTNTASNKSYDNIMYREDATDEFLGNCGVINLMAKFHLQPDQAKEISDHMPVWAAFSLTESQVTRVASTESSTTLQ